MATTARRCAFCGSATKLHREHALPQWLGELILRDLNADPRFSQGTLFRVKTIMEHGERVSRTLDLVTRRVCGTCNSTWMSALETKAEPILTKLLRMATVTLSPQDQRVLSLWTAKTAMTVALTRRGPDVVVPDGHFRSLMATQEPPSRSEVWLAAHKGKYFGCSTQVDKNDIASDMGSVSMGKYVMYSVTINIAGVVLQLTGDTMPDHWALEGASEPGPTATRIWPPTDGSVSWPPPHVLDDEGLARWGLVRPPSAALFDPSA